MKRYLSIITCAIFISVLFISGTGRDDIPLSKYYQFAKNPTFDCIGELYYKKKFQITCILIDSTHILTAGHGFYIDNDTLFDDSLYDENYKKWFYGKSPISQDLKKTEDYSIRIDGKKYKIKNIVIDERYKETYTRDYYNYYKTHPMDDKWRYDMAIAELAIPVKNVKPAILYEQGDELNKRAIFGGFGWIDRADEFNYDGRIKYKRRKMGGENMIDSVGGFKVDGIWAGLFIDFDAPDSDCCNRTGSSTPLALEYFPQAGDCGSGLFIEDNGVWKLAGMASSCPSHYTESVNYGEKYGKYYGFTYYYQRISAFNDWINEESAKKY